jgi:phage host-nuclease inhibitor protein Gam
VFVARQAHHREGHQAAIEKQFKMKQSQEPHVSKGKDLERISVKLERAQETVHAIEREYANFACALQDTVAKWEHDWKQFCDSCQDLEEERMGFTKDNVWAYANAVSTVCVNDDEVCVCAIIEPICDHDPR